MRRYDHLKDHPRVFLAATGLTLAEFTRLLPAKPLTQTFIRTTSRRKGQRGSGKRAVAPKGGWRAGKISCCLF